MSPRRCTVDLTLDLAAPHCARTLLCLVLGQWGVTDDDTRDGAAIVVSELVTNALIHADDGGPILLEIALDDGSLRISVADASSTVPAQRRADDVAESGRGLSIVDQLSMRWGVEPWPGGKRVFAELPLLHDHCA